MVKKNKLRPKLENEANISKDWVNIAKIALYSMSAFSFIIFLCTVASIPDIKVPAFVSSFRSGGSGSSNNVVIVNNHHHHHYYDSGSSAGRNNDADKAVALIIGFIALAVLTYYTIVGTYNLTQTGSKFHKLLGGISGITALSTLIGGIALSCSDLNDQDLKNAIPRLRTKANELPNNPESPSFAGGF